MTAVTSIVVPQDVPGVGSPRARALWTWAGLVLAALIVAALGVSSVGNLSYQLIPSRHRLFTARLALVNLKVARGDVTVESSSEPRTIVTTSGARGLTSPSDEERVSGDSLVIRSSCGQTFFNNRCDRNYVLRLPPTVSLNISTGEGNISVTGVEGEITLHSGEGDLEVQGGEANLRMTSGEGNISAVGLHARQLDADTSEGDVDLGFAIPPGRVTASSAEGSITIELPRGPASYQVLAGTAEGNVSTTVNEDSTSQRVIRARSAEGDVTVAYARRHQVPVKISR